MSRLTLQFYDVFIDMTSSTLQFYDVFIDMSRSTLQFYDVFIDGWAGRPGWAGRAGWAGWLADCLAGPHLVAKPLILFVQTLGKVAWPNLGGGLVSSEPP